MYKRIVEKNSSSKQVVKQPIKRVYNKRHYNQYSKTNYTIYL